MTASTTTLARPIAHTRREQAKNLAVSFFEWFGELGIFCVRLGRAALAPPYEIRELVRQCDEVGSRSLPLVALAGAATGVVLSLQTRDSLIHFGAKSLLPAVIFFSVVKESGPVITGLVVSGRVGAGIGAELGSMRVTEQTGILGAKRFPKILEMKEDMEAVKDLPQPPGQKVRVEMKSTATRA